MSKHTPGPWHVGPGIGLETSEQDTIWAGDTAVIPECVCTYEGELPDIKPEDLALMAAAPELLEVCGRLMEFADVIVGEHQDSVLIDRASKAYLDGVKALAKAKGESP